MMKTKEEKAIAAEWMRKWRAENPEKVKESRERSEKKRRKGGEKFRQEAEYQKQYRKENKDLLNEKRRARYLKDPSRVLEYQKRRYEADPSKWVERAKRWQAENPEKTRVMMKDLAKKYRAELWGSYVRSRLTKGSSLKNSEIPQELVELKRTQLKTHRKLKEIENEK